jgi:SPP1 family predicted phage head-tail adaptor
MIRAGKMRDLVTLMVPTTVTDSRFGNSTGFTAGDQEWCSVTATDGTEQWQDNDSGVQSYVAFLIRMRYRSDIMNQYRLVYQGQTLELLTVFDPDGRQCELEIKARVYPGASGC